MVPWVGSWLLILLHQLLHSDVENPKYKKQDDEDEIIDEQALSLFGIHGGHDLSEQTTFAALPKTPNSSLGFFQMRG